VDRIDIHQTLGDVAIWEEGRLRSFGRVDMTRTALEGRRARATGALRIVDRLAIASAVDTVCVEALVSSRTNSFVAIIAAVRRGYDVTNRPHSEAIRRKRRRGGLRETQ
jgi:hypothetical protein